VKVPISDSHVIDLEAPVLSAYEAVVDGVTYWLVWCKFCQKWHRHGAGAGHREAHCTDSASGYWERGYNLAYAGEWKGDGSPHI
jgi:hypothetical protein